MGRRAIIDSRDSRIKKEIRWDLVKNINIDVFSKEINKLIERRISLNLESILNKWHPIKRKKVSERKKKIIKEILLLVKKYLSWEDWIYFVSFESFYRLVTALPKLTKQSKDPENNIQNLVKELSFYLENFLDKGELFWWMPNMFPLCYSLLASYFLLEPKYIAFENYILKPQLEGQTPDTIEKLREKYKPEANKKQQAKKKTPFFNTNKRITKIFKYNLNFFIHAGGDYYIMITQKGNPFLVNNKNNILPLGKSVVLDKFRIGIIDDYNPTGATFLNSIKHSKFKNRKKRRQDVKRISAAVPNPKLKIIRGKNEKTN